MITSDEIKDAIRSSEGFRALWPDGSVGGDKNAAKIALDVMSLMQNKGIDIQISGADSVVQRGDTSEAWVSVTQRLPEAGSIVFVVPAKRKIRERMVFFARKNGESPNPNRSEWDYLDGDSCFEKITHWMPIPELPKL